MKIASDLEAGVQRYIEAIKADYVGRFGVPSAVREQMNKEFAAGISYEIHRKFIKVITGQASGNTSVHSFVMLEDDGKFKRGDLLKAASWRGPAKNFARGNILDETFNRVSWTGAH